MVAGWLWDKLEDAGKGTYNYLNDAGWGVANTAYSLFVNPFVQGTQGAIDIGLGAYNAVTEQDASLLWDSMWAATKDQLLRDTIGLGDGSDYAWFGEKGLGQQGLMAVLPETFWESYQGIVEVIDDTGSFVFTMLSAGVNKEATIWYENLTPEQKKLADQGILKYDPFGQSEDEREHFPEGVELSFKDNFAPLTLFDPETYKQAYAISFGDEERSFGQAFAVMHAGIDPFSEHQYNAIEGTLYFNVVSGMADFAQEIFLDPLWMLSPAMKLARGTSAIVRPRANLPSQQIAGVRGIGDEASVELYDIFNKSENRRKRLKHKVYVIGGDGARKFHVIKNTRPPSRFGADPAPIKTIQVNGVDFQLSWANATENITQIKARALVNHSRHWNEYNDVIEEAVPLSDFSPSYQLSGGAIPSAEDLVLIDKRVGALRQRLRRPEAKHWTPEVLTMIARGTTKVARDKTMRLALGDTQVLNEVMLSAPKAFDTLHEGTLLQRWEQAQGLRNQGVKAGKDLTRVSDEIVAKEKQLADWQVRKEGGLLSEPEIAEGQRLVKEIEDLRVQATALEVEMTQMGRSSDNLTAQLREEAELLANTDWLAFFDLNHALRDSWVKDVVATTGNPKITPTDVIKTMTGEEMALTKIIISDILGYANRTEGLSHIAQKMQPVDEITGLTSVGGTISDLPGRLSRVKGKAATVGRTFKNPYAASAYASYGKLQNSAGEWLTETYQIPTTLRPLGSQKLTYFHQRVNQRLIHFYDPAQSLQQWERMLSYANEFSVNGKRFIEADEVAELVGRWNRMMTEGADMSAFIAMYQETTQSLAKRANKLITEETGIKFYKGDKEVPLDQQLIASKKEYDELLTKGAAVDSSYPDPTFTANKTPTASGDMREATTMVFKNEAGEVLTEVHHGLSPAQMAQSMPMPRWDLLEDAINSHGRFNRYGVFEFFDNPHKIGNIEVPAIRESLGLKKGAVRKARKAVQRGVVTDAIAPAWTATTLLTPRWAMRVVGVDEQLRFMAVWGAMSKILGGPSQWKSLRRQYAAKGLQLSDDFLQKEMLKELKRKKIDVPEGASLADMNELLTTNNIDWTDLINSVKETAEQRLKDTPKKRTFKTKTIGGALTRFALSGLVHPFAGLAHAGKYAFGRYRSLNKHVEMVAAQQLGDSYIRTGRKMLAEAAPDNPAWTELAEMFLYEGELTKQRILKAAEKQGVGIKNVDEIVDVFEAADTFMTKAGYSSMRIGDNTFQNAMGDTMPWQKMNEDMVSARRSDRAAMRGAFNSGYKELVDYQKPRFFETYDFIDPRFRGRVAGDFEDIWGAHFNQWISDSPDTKAFFEIVWDTTRSKNQRVDDLAKLLETNKTIRSRIPNASVRAPGAATQSTKDYLRHIAQRSVDEADNMLPTGLPGFNNLRALAAKGERVTWAQINKLIKSKEMKHYLGRPLNADFEDIVYHIRRSSDSQGNTIDGIAPNFAKHNGAEGIFEQSKMHTRAAERMGAATSSAFESLGTMPSNQLSRHPFFKAKYDQYLMEQASFYQSLDGNYVFTPRQKQKMEQTARRRALEDTRDTLYDLVEHTRFAEAIGFMSPFFNAWQEVFGRWAGLAFENPVFVGRGARIFTSDFDAPVIGLEEKEDPFGRKKVFFNLSESFLADVPGFMDLVRNDTFNFGPLGSISEVAADYPLTFDKNGLFSMFASVTPGVGPLLTFTVQEAMYKDPSLDELTGFMFPYGVSSGNGLERLAKELLPSYAESIAFRTGTVYKNDQFNTRASKFFMDMMANAAESNAAFLEGNTDLEYIDLTDPLVVKSMMRDATQMAEAFGWFKTWGSLVIPVAVEQESEYFDLMQEYRTMREEDIATGYSSANPDEMISTPPQWLVQDSNGNREMVSVRPSDSSTIVREIGGRKVTGTEFTDNRFLAEHGDHFFWLTQRLTDSAGAAGIAPTIEGWELYEANKELIQTYPEIGDFLAQEVGDILSEEFSSVVYNKQKQESFAGTDETMRSVKTLEEVYEQGDEREGWRKYRHGLNNGKELAEEDLPVVFYDERGEIIPFVAGRGLAIDTTPQGATIYYNGEGMDEIYDQLAIRGFYNSSNNINATENYDLKVIRDFLVGQIAMEHPMWEEAYDDGSQSDRMTRVMEGFAAMFQHESNAWKGNGASPDLLEYIIRRQDIERRLWDAKYELGGSADITAETNTPILYDWAELQTECAPRPAFASTWQRYFANDMVPEDSWTFSSDEHTGMYEQEGLDVLLGEAREETPELVEVGR